MSSSASPTNARSSTGGDDFADTSVVINPNVDFVGSKRWWSAVMLGIYLIRSFIAALPIDQRYGWMWLHLFHCIFSFFVMHWSKGTPNSAADQGKWNKSTWWEQLDNGEQYTPTRKFLTILAFIPFFFSSYETQWATGPLFINFLALALVVIPKLPSMHSVRVLKINDE